MCCIEEVDSEEQILKNKNHSLKWLSTYGHYKWSTIYVLGKAINFVINTQVLYDSVDAWSAYNKILFFLTHYISFSVTFK